MNYSSLTVFNYKVAYYVIRLYSVYFLWNSYFKYKIFLQRPEELYEPVFYLQQLVFPGYPSGSIMLLICFACTILILISLVKESVLINLSIFILLIAVSVIVSVNYGIPHGNHLLLLCFFLSAFLLPSKLKSADYKYVQYFYLGLLLTYSLSGFWKLTAIAKSVALSEEKLSWISTNAAKINTMINYYAINQPVPDWMINIYSHEKYGW